MTFSQVQTQRGLSPKELIRKSRFKPKMDTNGLTSHEEFQSISYERPRRELGTAGRVHRSNARRLGSETLPILEEKANSRSQGHMTNPIFSPSAVGDSRTGEERHSEPKGDGRSKLNEIRLGLFIALNGRKAIIWWQCH